MKNTTVFGLAVIVVVIVGMFFFFKGGGATENVVNDGGTEGAQKVVLSVKNYNYYPQTINVKAGVPVSISLDSSVSGCLRSFTIPQLGVAKNLRTPQDNVEFTPKEKGTYRFQCSMGMGYGTIVVA